MKTFSEQDYRDYYSIGKKNLKFEITDVHIKAIEFLDPSPGETIIDLGCGKGEVIKLLTDFGVKAIGIDYLNEFLEIAKSNVPEGEFIKGNILNLPLENAFSDKLVCLGVLGCLSKKDVVVAVKEMNRILKFKGIGVIRVGTKINSIGRFFLKLKHPNEKFASNLYALGFYKNIFLSNGFKILKIERSVDVKYSGLKNIFFKLIGTFFASTWFIIQKVK